MKNYLLGADVGTSSVKVVLFDTEGNTVGVAKRGYALSRPAPGFVEQDPTEYGEGAFACLRELMDRFPEAKNRLLAFGAVGQNSTEVLLDQAGQVIRPAIVWQDMRAGDQAGRINQAISREARQAAAGWACGGYGNGTPARLLWLREQEPQTAARLWRTMEPKDYVNFCLTGEAASDHWSYRNTANLYTGKVFEELFDFLGYPATVLPPLCDSWQVMGRVSARAAERTGLPQGLPVAAGSSDSLGTMLGSGAFSRPGLGFDSTGTSEIVGMTVTKDYPMKGLTLLPGGVLKFTSVLYGTTQCGGSALLWLNQLTHATDYAAAVAACADIPAGSDGVVFLPYLNGERAPLWDSRATGSFTGLLMSHDSRHLTRAVMEGVAMSVRHCLEIARDASGEAPEEIRLIGGGSRTGLWNQIRADVCGVPFVTLESEESGALGAATLAGLACGLWQDIPSASRSLVRVKDRFEPNEVNREIYDALYRRYRYDYEAQVTYRERNGQ